MTRLFGRLVDEVRSISRKKDPAKLPESEKKTAGTSTVTARKQHFNHALLLASALTMSASCVVGTIYDPINDEGGSKGHSSEGGDVNNTTSSNGGKGGHNGGNGGLDGEGGNGGFNTGGEAGNNTTGGGGATIELRSYSNGSACLPASSPFVQDRLNQPSDPQSDEIIQNVMEELGGNGFGIPEYQGILGACKTDFSFILLHATSSTPFVKFQPQYWSDWYHPDCSWHAQPLPNGGSIEGNVDYTNANGGDAHLLVLLNSYPGGECRSFETWKWNTWEEKHESGCQATWDLRAEYSEEGRGLGCSSADAAGYPVASLIPTPEAVQQAIDNGSYDLGVGIRVAFPNEVIKHLTFHAPATHGTKTYASGNVFEYGDVLVLNADYDISGYAPGAQVLLNTLKKRGAFIADGGKVWMLLGGTNPGVEQHDGEWTSLGVDYETFLGLKLTDFRLVERTSPSQPQVDCIVSDQVLEPCGDNGLANCVPSENRVQYPELNP